MTQGLVASVISSMWESILPAHSLPGMFTPSSELIFWGMALPSFSQPLPSSSSAHSARIVLRSSALSAGKTSSRFLRSLNVCRSSGKRRNMSIIFFGSWISFWRLRAKRVTWAGTCRKSLIFSHVPRGSEASSCSRACSPSSSARRPRSSIAVEIGAVTLELASPRNISASGPVHSTVVTLWTICRWMSCSVIMLTRMRWPMSISCAVSAP